MFDPKLIVNIITFFASITTLIICASAANRLAWGDLAERRQRVVGMRAQHQADEHASEALAPYAELAEDEFYDAVGGLDCAWGQQTRPLLMSEVTLVSSVEARANV